MHRPSPWTAGFNPSDYGESLPRAIKAAGGAIWSPYYGDVSPALVNEAHHLGLTVIVWTVNEPVDMVRLIEMGADGIISDRPDLLRKVSGERGISLPVP